ncbi:MAG: hypothetical protein CSA33_04185 [Desulfobulbus propionicus]|nr:MAG: hypothetical protein CSA33_04185 [Desulfobulbus propionicus]
MQQERKRLEKLWLRQLQREWDSICYQYDLPLKMPLFRVTSSTTTLGSWQEHERLISLSSHLILNYPWLVTLQVFKHEIAHQCCSEIWPLNRKKEKDHGQTFLEACAFLGVEPAFQRAHADTEQGVRRFLQGAQQTEESRVMDKIRKLLQLGGSGNEHEAAAALVKAGELMDRYSLQLDQFDEQSAVTSVMLRTGKQRLSATVKSICSLLDRHFSVRVIILREYDPLADKEYKVLVLYGLQEQVALAEHCYHFLEERLDTLWKAYKKRQSQTRRVTKKSYELGLLAGFAEKLRQKSVGRQAQPAQQEPVETRELARLEQRVDDFVRARHPKLVRTRRSQGSYDPGAYHQARKQGENLDFNTPVAGEGVRLIT